TYGLETQGALLVREQGLGKAPLSAAMRNSPVGVHEKLPRRGQEISPLRSESPLSASGGGRLVLGSSAVPRHGGAEDGAGEDGRGDHGDSGCLRFDGELPR